MKGLHTLGPAIVGTAFMLLFGMVLGRVETPQREPALKIEFPSTVLLVQETEPKETF